MRGRLGVGRRQLWFGVSSRPLRRCPTRAVPGPPPSPGDRRQARWCPTSLGPLAVGATAGASGGQGAGGSTGADPVRGDAAPGLPPAGRACVRSRAADVGAGASRRWGGGHRPRRHGAAGPPRRRATGRAARRRLCAAGRPGAGASRVRGKPTCGGASHRLSWPLGRSPSAW